jgi:hypothetical protein
MSEPGPTVTVQPWEAAKTKPHMPANVIPVKSFFEFI